MSRYDIDNKQLDFISEKSGDSDNMIPRAIDYTLSHQLDRCILLATDENGYYFFGIYNLIEGNDDKYVNAVFFDDKDQNKIISLYEYFCNNQYDATKQLMDSVVRLEVTPYKAFDLEYSIDSRIIAPIITSANEYAVDKEMNTFAPNFLLAFITTGEYSDNQIILEERFNVKKMFLYEKCEVDNNMICNYQLATKNTYKDSLPISILLPLVVGGGVGITGLIVILLVFFL